MKSSTSRTEKRKAKSKTAAGGRPKPKRPMTAYNFFFREERRKILAEQKEGAASGDDTEGDTAKKPRLESHEAGGGSELQGSGELSHIDAEDDMQEASEVTSSSKKRKKRSKQDMSFEGLGRIIGQRWRDISEKDLAKYTAMAEEDSKRYRREMKKYYDDEITSLCRGYNSRDGDGDALNQDTSAAKGSAAAATAAAPPSADEKIKVKVEMDRRIVAPMPTHSSPNINEGIRRKILNSPPRSNVPDDSSRSTIAGPSSQPEAASNVGGLSKDDIASLAASVGGMSNPGGLASILRQAGLASSQDMQASNPLHLLAADTSSMLPFSASSVMPGLFGTSPLGMGLSGNAALNNIPTYSSDFSDPLQSAILQQQNLHRLQQQATIATLANASLHPSVANRYALGGIGQQTNSLDHLLRAQSALSGNLGGGGTVEQLLRAQSALSGNLGVGGGLDQLLRAQAAPVTSFGGSMEQLLRAQTALEGNLGSNRGFSKDEDGTDRNEDKTK